MSQRGNHERNFFLKGPVINKNKNNIDIYINTSVSWYFEKINKFFRYHNPKERRK